MFVESERLVGASHCALPGEDYSTLVAPWLIVMWVVLPKSWKGHFLGGNRHKPHMDHIDRFVVRRFPAFTACSCDAHEVKVDRFLGCPAIASFKFNAALVLCQNQLDTRVVGKSRCFPLTYHISDRVIQSWSLQNLLSHAFSDEQGVRLNVGLYGFKFNLQRSSFALTQDLGSAHSARPAYLERRGIHR